MEPAPLEAREVGEISWESWVDGTGNDGVSQSPFLSSPPAPIREKTALEVRESVSETPSDSSELAAVVSGVHIEPAPSSFESRSGSRSNLMNLEQIHPGIPYSSSMDSSDVDDESGNEVEHVHQQEIALASESGLQLSTAMSPAQLQTQGLHATYTLPNKLSSRAKQATYSGAASTKPSNSSGLQAGSSPLPTIAKKKKSVRARVGDLSPDLVHRCPITDCQKQFAKKYNLKIHVRRHTGQLPFLCEIHECGKRFMWHSSFLRHQKSHERKPGGRRRRSRKVRVELSPDTETLTEPAIVPLPDQIDQLAVLMPSQQSQQQYIGASFAEHCVEMSTLALQSTMSTNATELMSGISMGSSVPYPLSFSLGDSALHLGKIPAANRAGDGMVQVSNDSLPSPAGNFDHFHLALAALQPSGNFAGEGDVHMETPSTDLAEEETIIQDCTKLSCNIADIYATGDDNGNTPAADYAMDFANADFDGTFSDMMSSIISPAAF